MNAPAAGLALALLLSQSESAPERPASPEPPPAQAEPPPAVPVSPAPRPDAEPAAEPAAEAPPPAPSGPVPVPSAPQAPKPQPAPPAPAEPARPAPQPPAAPQAAAPAAAAPRPVPEREQAVRAALSFLDALVRGDPDALAGQCAQRFSFDGDIRSGVAAVSAGWREALARRPPDAPARLLDLEVLPAADAVARLGPPPPRVAPLVARGWVGVANVSGRPVVLFLAREGARMVVTGMHD